MPLSDFEIVSCSIKNQKQYVFFAFIGKIRVSKMSEYN